MQGTKDKYVFQDCLSKGCILITKGRGFKDMRYNKLKGLIILRGEDKHIVKCSENIARFINPRSWLELEVRQGCKIRIVFL